MYMYANFFIGTAIMILIMCFCVAMRNKCRDIPISRTEVAIGQLVLAVPESAITVDVDLN